MKANVDKKIEDLVDHIMKDSVLETPSFDFTTKVMSQVLATEESKATVYRPLITKSVFLAVFGLGTILCLSLNGESHSQSWLSQIEYSKLFSIDFCSKYSISKISVYAILASIIMFFIQIPILKNHFDKRFEA